jgi:hypothetical protein
MKTLLLAGTVLSALAAPAMAEANYSYRGGWTVDSSEYSDDSGTFCSAIADWKALLSSWALTATRKRTEYGG